MKRIAAFLISLIMVTEISLGYISTVKVGEFSGSVTSEEGNVVKIIPKVGIERWEVKQGNVVVTDNQFTMPKENVEIEGIVKNKKTLTIEFLTYTKIEQITEGLAVTVQADTSAEHVFTNWTATGITLTESQRTNPEITFTMPGNAVTLIANYTSTDPTPEVTTYTISYNANGGSGAPGNQTKTQGTALTLSSTMPTKAGYIFRGWNTNQNAITAEYHPGDSFTVDVNAILYAVWKEAPAWNVPYLGTELTPVNWDATNKTWVATTESNWDYNYDLASKWSNSVGSSTYGVEGDGTARWANAKTADGSLYVWIPRFTYYKQTTTGKVSWNADIKGTSRTYILWSNETQDYTTDSSGATSYTYNKHRAFTLTDKSGNITEITGFWVAKYEASEGTNGVPQSLPDVSPWSGDIVNDMYAYGMNLNGTNTNIGAHLIKDSEWGAVAYLTSALGRIPYKNNRSLARTGYAGATQDALSSSTDTYLWNTENGVRGSTTHNVYGVYDMSGGDYEHTALYNYFVEIPSDSTALQTSYYTYGTKYVDYFGGSGAPADSAVIHWDSDYNDGSSDSRPVMRRGGSRSDLYGGSYAGIFSAWGDEKSGEGSFRVTLFGRSL